MTLSDEAKSIQKRIGSTPFPENLQGIVDDAHLIIARQAFKITQLETPEKTHGYKVGHIAGLYAGIRKAADLFDADPHVDDTEGASIKRRILHLIDRPT
jgi:hypothetical protein